jgi:hypothetical protein
MNIENIKKVIAAIADEENFFSMVTDYVYPKPFGGDMELWEEAFGTIAVPNCGTPACISGWATYLSGNDPEPCGFDVARAFMGLVTDTTLSYDLFYPSHKSWKDITRAEAIDTLNRLIETGEVVWEKGE